MLESVLISFGTLALGLQAVHAQFTFTFPDVQQCGPFDITFDQPPSNPPQSVTVVPFNSTSISIAIPNSSGATTGVAVSYLPLPAGTRFIASLNDATGNTIGNVTDVLTVLPSPIGNSSCLPPLNITTPPLYQLQGTLTQCAHFNVTYNPAVVPNPPTIRAFIPQGPSLLLNPVSSPTTNGTGTYILAIPVGDQAVFVYEDGSGSSETTNLATVGGNFTSDTSCLSPSVTSNGTPSESASTSSSIKTSKRTMMIVFGTIIAIMVIVLCLMVTYVMRERRKRRQLHTQSQHHNNGFPRSPLTSDLLHDKVVSPMSYPPTQALSYVGRPLDPLSRHNTIRAPDSYPFKSNLAVPAHEASPEAENAQVLFVGGQSNSHIREKRLTDPSESSVDMEHFLDLAKIYPERENGLDNSLPSRESNLVTLTPLKQRFAASETRSKMLEVPRPSNIVLPSKKLPRVPTDILIRSGSSTSVDSVLLTPNPDLSSSEAPTPRGMEMPFSADNGHISFMSTSSNMIPGSPSRVGDVPRSGLRHHNFPASISSYDVPRRSDVSSEVGKGARWKGSSTLTPPSPRK